MRMIGLVGGTSWISTAEYYKQINLEVNKQLAGLNYSHCVLYSFNYAEIKKLVDQDDWDTISDLVVKASRHLKSCGAQAIVLCANTLHLIADDVEQQTGLPVIHIATATKAEIKRRALKKVGLLGTKFTMEMDFFKARLLSDNIEVIIPGQTDRDFVHDTIYRELGKGIVLDETKARYLAIIDDMVNRGAEGIILGCTELPLIIRQDDIPVPVFDTAMLHVRAAVGFALG